MRLRSAAQVFLVDDIASTARWYAEILDFTAAFFPPDPPHGFAVLQRDGAEIMLQQLGGYAKPDLYPLRAGGVWDVYFRMDGVAELFDEVAARVPDAIVEPLCRQFYGDTEFVLRDPNGYVLVFSELES